MWWSDGAGSMKVASLDLVTARLAFGNAMEFLHGVWTVGGSVLSSQACSVCWLHGTISVCCMLRATSRTFLSPDFDRLYGGMPPPYDLALFELPFLWIFV